MLTHAPAGGAARPGAAVTEKDAANERPLDIALTTQQWRAVRLLVAAGALTKCPEVRFEIGGRARALHVIYRPPCACGAAHGARARAPVAR
jgi:hypothetical protein